MTKLLGQPEQIMDERAAILHEIAPSQPLKKRAVTPNTEAKEAPPTPEQPALPAPVDESAQVRQLSRWLSEPF